MKVCKVRPDRSTCSQCLAMSDLVGIIPDCKECADTYGLLQIGAGFLSVGYAIVQRDGNITKVSLSRVYDVKEV